MSRRPAARRPAPSPEEAAGRARTPVPGVGGATPRPPGLDGVRAELARRGSELQEEVGYGSVGAVYRAREPAAGRTVAVKLLHPDLLAEPEAVRRFLREGRALARFTHPRVVAPYQAFFLGDLPVMVLEWVPGPNLRDLVLSAGPLGAGRALALVRDVAEGLGALHAAGMVHRDVKPANVLLRADGSACLADFGLVRGLASAGSAALTSAGTVLGTMHYTAPEQAADPRVATAASDTYSLGATLLHLLTGRAPFADLGWQEVLLRMARGEVPSLPERLADAPPGLRALLVRLLAADPAARPADVRSPLAALAQVAERAERVRGSGDAG